MIKKDKRKYSDRSEYLKKAVILRRKKLREMALKYKGDKCQICGYNMCIQALEFHHLDSTKKDFSPSGITKSWSTIQRELNKSILLCANCHREIHANILQLPQAIEIEKRG